MERGVALLGSTGSIGTQTLQVVQAFPDQFNVTALAAGGNVDLLAKQVETFRPSVVATGDRQSASRLRRLVSGDVKITWGDDGLNDVIEAEHTDIVVTAVVGAVGLRPTISALRAGMTVAVANKESLVAAGQLVMEAAAEGDAAIIPVDSEHAAIHQALRGERHRHIERIVLTASGGPFRRAAISDMQRATPKDALKHPTWDMGGKITIDSATLMNKGLEVIEAHHLFNVPYEQIDVVIHPESIVHSFVEFVDGVIIAQMGTADMRTPIQYALTYPERLETPWPRLSLTDVRLNFETPDRDKFPALDLAYEAGKTGGTAPAVLNAANEVAVEAFLSEKISFPTIVHCVEKVLSAHTVDKADDLQSVLDADGWARRKAEEIIGGYRSLP